MAISSAEVIGRREVFHLDQKVIIPNSSPNLVLRNDNIEKPDFSLITKNSFHITRPVLIFQERPLAPFEPKPYELSGQEWEEYIHKKNAAESYALENDLRGTF